MSVCLYFLSPGDRGILTLSGKILPHGAAAAVGVAKPSAWSTMMLRP